MEIRPETVLTTVISMISGMFGSCIKWLITEERYRRVAWYAEAGLGAFSGLMLIWLYFGNALGSSNVYLVFAGSGFLGIAGIKGLQVVISKLFVAGLLKEQSHFDRRKTDRKEGEEAE
jgi:hypothetical protein